METLLVAREPVGTYEPPEVTGKGNQERRGVGSSRGLLFTHTAVFLGFTDMTPVAARGSFPHVSCPRP